MSKKLLGLHEVPEGSELQIKQESSSSESGYKFALMNSAGKVMKDAVSGGAVRRDDIRNDAINGDKIADDAVDSEHLAAASIDAEHLHGDLIDDHTSLGAVPADADQLLLSDTGTSSTTTTSDVSSLLSSSTTVNTSSTYINYAGSEDGSSFAAGDIVTFTASNGDFLEFEVASWHSSGSGYLSMAYVSASGDAGSTYTGTTYMTWADAELEHTESGQTNALKKVSISNLRAAMSSGLIVAGDGIDATANLSTGATTIDLDLLASGGLKISGADNELAVEPADFAGHGLEDDGSDNLKVKLHEASAGDSGLEVSADGLRVKSGAITSDMIGDGEIVNADISASAAIASSKIAELDNFDTADLAEGTNLYYTDARARASVSHVDAGGDGSFAYDSSTGVFTYTGPSASEVRAHFTAGDGLAVSAGDFSVNVDDSSIEINADTLRVKAGGITSAMIADGAIVNADISATAAIASSKIAELSAFDTDDLAEGASNLYWTVARGESMFDSKLAAADTDDLSEGVSNLYYTDARVRAAVSASDLGGDGSFSYDSSTGVFSYTGPSAAEVRAHFSAGTGVAIASGVISIGQPVATTDDVQFNDMQLDGNLVVAGNLTINGSQNVIEADTVQIKDTLLDMGMEDDGSGGLQVPSSASTKDQGFVFNRMDGNGNNSKEAIFWDESEDKFRMAKNVVETNGVLTNTGSLATLQANLEGDVTGDVTGQVSDVSNHDTDDIAEGVGNLYFTQPRARASVSASDLGGDGSFSYDSSTGVFSYTGPSAAEVRAHFVGGDGLTLSGGTFGVNVDDSSIEIDNDILRVKALGITNAMLAGAIASTKIAELNNFDTDDLAEGASNLYWTVARGESMFDSKMAAADTDDLSEGASNLYFTEARARASVSVTDAGGDGSLAYDSSTGVITYTGPSASEVRAHLSVADSTSIDMSYDSSSGRFEAVALVDDSSIEIDASEGLRLKDSGVVAAKIADDAVTLAKLAHPASAEQINGMPIAWSQVDGAWDHIRPSAALQLTVDYDANGEATLASGAPAWASQSAAGENVEIDVMNDAIFGDYATHNLMGQVFIETATGVRELAGTNMVVDATMAQDPSSPEMLVKFDLDGAATSQSGVKIFVMLQKMVGSLIS